MSNSTLYIDGTTVTSAWANDVNSTTYSKVNIMPFLPTSEYAAIRGYTSSLDLSTYIQSAINSAAGAELYFPPGKYSFGTTLNVPKTNNTFRMSGDVGGYNGNNGPLLVYTGSGTAIQVGIDDGNPDSTGYLRRVMIDNLTLSTTNGTTGINVNNTSFFVLKGNFIQGFKGNILSLAATVITKISGNDIRGSGSIVDGSNSCIYMSNEYFGNYVVDIDCNHLYQANWAVTFGKGRRVRLKHNTCENLMGWTSGNDNLGGLFQFSQTGPINSLSIRDTYVETQRGYMFYQNAAGTGEVMVFTAHRNEFGGSTDATNQNPGVGNLLRDQYINCSFRDNYVLDLPLDIAAGIGLSANQWIANSSVFTSASSIDPGMVTLREAEDSLARAMATTEILGRAGDFCDLSGGTGGSWPNIATGGTAPGWANESGRTVDLVSGGNSSIFGTFYIHSAGGSFTDLCHVTFTIPSSATTTNMVLSMTYKDRVIVKINGTQLFDSGSVSTLFTSKHLLYSIPPSTTSVTIQLTCANSVALSIAEMRTWIIGTGEVSTATRQIAGGLTPTVFLAAARNLKRGAH